MGHGEETSVVQLKVMCMAVRNMAAHLASSTTGFAAMFRLQTEEGAHCAEKMGGPALLLEHLESPLRETILGAELGGWEKPSQLPTPSDAHSAEGAMLGYAITKNFLTLFH